MQRLLAVTAALLLSACASAPTGAPVRGFLADARFAPPAQPVRAQAALEPSPGMRAYAARLAARPHRKGAHHALMAALNRQLRIDYDAERTRTAAEAFAARSGNCLSLVLMTAALARELNVPIVYQAIYGQDTWSRSGGVAFRSGHINLVLGRRGPERVINPDDSMVVDFLPPEAVRHLFARPVPESLVLAMYLNNRAAETLATGQLDEAYWWAREALLTAPSFVSAYNTLGVIYRRHGAMAEAERVLRQALQLEPHNSQVLSNLALVLQARGAVAEATSLRRRLSQIDAHPPFYFYDQGLKALRRGDDEAATASFRRELERMPYDDQLHYLAAVASLRQGELRQARRHVEQALELSGTRERREIYAAKLERLRQYQKS